jgi:ribose/xylose/arabinose/galactoside ABC-type transport system permease subunit
VHCSLSLEANVSALGIRSSDLAAGATGAVAGLIASVVQVGVGWTLDAVLNPPGHDNNIAPRLVDRATRIAGKRPNGVLDWVLGTAFHFGYGLGWGTLFGVLRQRLRLPSLLLGTAMGGAIYLVGFSRAGWGTLTGTESHPERRPWQKQASLISVAMTYALCVALLFDRLPSPPRR